MNIAYIRLARTNVSKCKRKTTVRYPYKNKEYVDDEGASLDTYLNHFVLFTGFNKYPSIRGRNVSYKSQMLIKKQSWYHLQC